MDSKFYSHEFLICALEYEEIYAKHDSNEFPNIHLSYYIQQSMCLEFGYENL